MSTVANGARYLLNCVGDGFLFAYERISTWKSEHPKETELLEILIKGICIKIATEIIGDAILKAIHSRH